MGAIKNYYHDEICGLPETPDPYDEQLAVEEAKFDRLKPREFFNTGGLSHYSCSS